MIQGKASIIGGKKLEQQNELLINIFSTKKSVLENML